MLESTEDDGLKFLVEVILDGSVSVDLATATIQAKAQRTYGGPSVNGSAVLSNETEIGVWFPPGSLKKGGWLIQVQVIAGNERKTWKFEAKIDKTI